MAGAVRRPRRLDPGRGRRGAAALAWRELDVPDRGRSATPTADHGFHCDVRPSYNAEAATDAWARTLALVRRTTSTDGAGHRRARRQAHRVDRPAARVLRGHRAAPTGGHVNLSPKGHDSLRVLDPSTVAYLDLTGSGAETIAHTAGERAHHRHVLRLRGAAADPAPLRPGEAHPVGSRALRRAGARASRRSPARASIVTVAIERVQTSCGYSIPFMDYRDERPTLQQWAERKGDDGLARVLGREERRRASTGSPPSTRIGNHRVALGWPRATAARRVQPRRPRPRSWPDWCRRLEAARHRRDQRRRPPEPGALPPLVGAGRGRGGDRAGDPVDDGAEQRAAAPSGAGQRGGHAQASCRGAGFTLGIGAGHARGRARRHRPPAAAARRAGRLGSRRRSSSCGACSAARPSPRRPEPTTSPTSPASPAPTHPVPLLVGGGSTGVLRVAARHADVVGLTGFSHVDGRTRGSPTSAPPRSIERLELVRGLPRRSGRAAARSRPWCSSCGSPTTVRRRPRRWSRSGATPSPLTVDEVLDCRRSCCSGTAERDRRAAPRAVRAPGASSTWTAFAGRPSTRRLDDLGRWSTALDADSGPVGADR